jgi:hypothetical protein
MPRQGLIGIIKLGRKQNSKVLENYSEICRNKILKKE